MQSTHSPDPFAPGDIIEFVDDQYEVVTNFGREGYVREYPNGVDTHLFFWRFEGEECRLVSRFAERERRG